MNPAHIHLMVNHFPIISTILGIIVLIAGLNLKNITIKRTALGIIVFAAFSSLAPYFTGEGAERVVSELPGISKAMIETHEDSAIFFLVALFVSALIAGLTFYFDLEGKKMTKTFYLIVLGFSLFTLSIAIRVGITGGEIRHTEIRSGSSSTITQPPPGHKDSEKNEHENETK